jgi:hypothetical protein
MTGCRQPRNWPSSRAVPDSLIAIRVAQVPRRLDPFGIYRHLSPPSGTAGAEAYRKDLNQVELHMLDAGHVMEQFVDALGLTRRSTLS